MTQKFSRATDEVRQTLQTMAARFGGPVFDEWALIRLAEGKPEILAYEGPRKDRFQADLPRDIQPLRAVLGHRRLAVGDLDFAHEGDGERYEAILVAGRGIYLILNHTAKNMSDIVADPRWRQAQRPLADLAERFRLGPVEG